MESGASVVLSLKEFVSLHVILISVACVIQSISTAESEQKTAIAGPHITSVLSHQRSGAQVRQFLESKTVPEVQRYEDAIQAVLQAASTVGDQTKQCAALDGIIAEIVEYRTQKNAQAFAALQASHTKTVQRLRTTERKIHCGVITTTLVFCGALIVSTMIQICPPHWSAG
jgi:hypothetical protein